MNITPEKLDELIRIVHLAGVEIIKIYKKKVTKNTSPIIRLLQMQILRQMI